MTNTRRTRLAVTLPLAGLLAASLLAGCHHDEAPNAAANEKATYPGGKPPANNYPGGQGAVNTNPGPPPAPQGPAGH